MKSNTHLSNAQELLHKRGAELSKKRRPGTARMAGGLAHHVAALDLGVWLRLQRFLLEILLLDGVR